MKNLIRYLFPFFKNHKWMLIWGFLCVLVHNYLKVYSTKVIGQAFNFVEEITQKEQDLSSTFQIALLKGGWYFALSIVSGIFLFFTRQTIIVMSRKIEYEIKNEIYAHYQRLDQQFYRKNSIGDLMNRISEDVSKVRMFLGPTILYGMNLMVTSIIVIYFMLQKNVELTLYCLLPLPIMSVIIYYISTKMNRLNHEAQKEQSLLSAMAQENFSGIRVIKSYGKLDLMQNLFQEQIKKYRQKVLKVTKVEAWFAPSIATLVGLSTILSIYLGGLKVISGELRVGDIAEFVVFINLLTWPFASLGWITSLTQAAIVSEQRIHEFLKAESSILNTEQAKKDIAGNIHFENVSLRYPTTNIEALHQINFSISAEKTLGILGNTGSGKSTFVQLILRLMDPSSGKISMDSTDIRHLNLEQLRSEIAYIPQEVFLFSDTIYNNIAFGMDHARKQDVEKAAELTQIHETILQFPDGYQTVLGERGINLSGGQKQRLSMARAFLKALSSDQTSPIASAKILILDDALSAVDTQTEKNILQNLQEIRQKMTTLIISQRISSVVDADEIIVLAEGKIIQKGNHHSLMQEKEGFYYNQYQTLLEQR